MIYVLIGIVLILWIYSLLALFSKMKTEIKCLEETSEIEINKLQSEINLLLNEVERYKEIDKEAEKEKKSIRTGDNKSNFDRATAIMRK